MADNKLDITTYKKLKYGLEQIEYQNRRLESYTSSIQLEKKEIQKQLDSIAKLEAKIEASKKIISLAEEGEYIPSYLSEQEVKRSYESDFEFHTWEITYVLLPNPNDGKPITWENAEVPYEKDRKMFEPELNIIRTETITLPKDQQVLTPIPYHIYYRDRYCTAGKSYGSPSAGTDYYGPDREYDSERVCVVLKMEKKWENSIGHHTSLISVLTSKCFFGLLVRRLCECTLRVDIKSPDDAQQERKKRRY